MFIISTRNAVGTFLSGCGYLSKNKTKIRRKVLEELRLAMSDINEIMAIHFLPYPETFV